MATVRELKGGDLVTRPGSKPAVFIVACPHPQLRQLVLVFWRMANGSIRLDELLPGDEVGTVEPIEPAARAERLAEALIN